MTNSEIVFTDRYGGNYPNAETVCKGPCEGMGVYPLFNPDRADPKGLRPVDATKLEGATLTVWLTAHSNAGDHFCDGWHFVTCPDCQGTGRR